MEKTLLLIGAAVLAYGFYFVVRLFLAPPGKKFGAEKEAEAAAKRERDAALAKFQETHKQVLAKRGQSERGQADKKTK